MILFDPIARGVYQLLYYMTKFMKSKDAFLSVVMSKSYFRKSKNYMYVFDFKLYTFCWFAFAVSYGSCIWGKYC